MRSNFRFPRTTQVLMTLILVAVVFAIKQGQAIVADANAPENWTAVLLLFLWVFALLCALGSGGYAIIRPHIDKRHRKIPHQSVHPSCR